MFASKVFSAISARFKSTTNGSKGSFRQQAAKRLVGYTIGTGVILSGCAYMEFLTFLETRKFVDPRQIELYIHADRNIFGTGPELDTSYTTAAIFESYKLMKQMREVAEPALDEETRLRYKKEAHVERNALLNTLIFNAKREESEAILNNMLPFFFSPLERKLMAQAATQKKLENEKKQ